LGRQDSRKNLEKAEKTSEGVVRSLAGVETIDACPDLERPLDTDAHGVLADHEIATLRKIMCLYEAQGLDSLAVPRRPRFKQPRINSGITCNDEIRRRALAKAQADPATTGGSLSSLIEVLLWQFIGCPPDVVEGRREESIETRES
jgi:hypothetical protein